jgi:hypothetical protein
MDSRVQKFKVLYKSLDCASVATQAIKRASPRSVLLRDWPVACSLLSRGSTVTMTRYVMELIGKFFLVLTMGVFTIDGAIPPLAVGSVLMAIIFCRGPSRAATTMPS